jgi:hypothetical protein
MSLVQLFLIYSYSNYTHTSYWRKEGGNLIDKYKIFGNRQIGSMEMKVVQQLVNKKMILMEVFDWLKQNQ